MFSPESQQA